ncbi:fic family toxin-antitoxin system, toxin component (plasmid) [Streptomyces sp. NBC_01298]|uniref:fic family toxin-antitoxin system, toxin component n=1 Tax=Streptomyces sp. NBC_01298 TaxID=2903817 RepID=UPI002E0F3B02|nr:fic family toxin-antitoxin system, toxin component [Streptomyces sp. NBC_01298]
MTRFLTPPELLQIAQTLPGDPACRDLGILDAVCARARAHYMHQDVYSSLWLKAAAMLETIVLHEPLEKKNHFFAWLCAETFLATNEVYMTYEPEDALALVLRIKHKGIDDLREVSAQLRAWTIPAP